MEKNGYIYILVNESFHRTNWIKIGYASDVDRRIRELSNTSVPLPYELYAKYEIPYSKQMASSDKQVHALIEALNPDLRISSSREFFEIEPEDAYNILYAMAKIHDREDKLIDGPARKRDLKEDSQTTKNTIVRTSLPRWDWCIAQGLIKKGDIIAINNYESETAQVVDETGVLYKGKKMSFNEFGVTITGWKSIQTYAFIHIVGEEESIADKREARMKELGITSV